MHRSKIQRKTRCALPFATGLSLTVARLRLNRGDRFRKVFVGSLHALSPSHAGSLRSDDPAKSCRYLLRLSSVRSRKRYALVEHYAELRVALDDCLISFCKDRSGCSQTTANDCADSSALAAASNRAYQRARSCTAAYEDRDALDDGAARDLTLSNASRRVGRDICQCTVNGTGHAALQLQK